MAQKRMFDRAIIDTDKFMDLGLTSKAMYFLLGMEADDEGFVSYKKVLRIHGGNEDDVKILVAKGFLILFPSGVVVITDWNANNYLDKNRMRPTEYQNEKAILSLTDSKRYVLNVGLTYVQPEERRGEEKRIEESRPTASLSFLKAVPPDVLEAFSKEYSISPKGIQSKATDLLLWCQSKSKVYKNYKAFLENALRKDQIQLRNQYPLSTGPVVSDSVREAANLTPDQIEANKERIAKMREGLVEQFKS